MKLLVITGGSRGLGLALVEQFQQQGYAILDFSRTAPHPFSVACDLSDPLSCARIMRRSLAAFSDEPLRHIVAIHNAGTLDPMGPCVHKDSEQIIANVHTNYLSGILFFTEIQRAFQVLDCPKFLLQVSSGAAHKGYAGWSLYCAAKAGLENFVRSLALEQALQDHPFHVLNIIPGIMDTHMQEQIRSVDPQDFPARERFVQLYQKGALASPIQVAQRIWTIVNAPTESGSTCDVANFVEK